MRVGITGGTGFVGGHLAVCLANQGHDVTVITRGVDHRPLAREVLSTKGVRLVTAGLDDKAALSNAFAGCEAVAHCAGINRAEGNQTFAAVHVRGTENVVRAAEEAGVRRLALLSFLRARPRCGSAYHESKWAAEEVVRASHLEWTVLKPGMMFGRGDHMLDHLTRALCTVPVFASVGHRLVRPLAVGDVVNVLQATLVVGRLRHKTVPLVGPTEIEFDDAVRTVGQALGKHVRLLRLPFSFLYAAGRLAEGLMTVPLISVAQVRILSEEVIAPVLAPDSLPTDLAPSTPFSVKTIKGEMPDCAPFRLTDLRWFATKPSSAHRRR